MQSPYGLFNSTTVQILHEEFALSGKLSDHQHAQSREVSTSAPWVVIMDESWSVLIGPENIRVLHLSGSFGGSHGQIAAGREHHDRQKGQAGFHRFPFSQWLINTPQARC